MAKNRNYTVAFRRKRKGLTNYAKRRVLLQSGRPRFVVRRFLSNISVQVVSYSPTGDRTLACASSLELAKSFGWLGHGGNLPSAYLVGFLVAKKALAQGCTSAVVDIGFAPSRLGSAFFAAAKGAIDAGLQVPCSEKACPATGRMDGTSIAAYAQVLRSSDKDKYQRQFSAYISRGVAIEKFASHVREVKEKIIAQWS